MPAIHARRAGPVLVLTIDNPARRNAFTHAMTAQLRDCLEAAEADAAVRAVVITGTGDLAFSSGHDLGEMLADRDHASDADLNAAFVLPARMTTPTIAAVNGPALAAGFILALNCDLRVAVPGARFAAPGARIGLLPIGGQIARLPRLLPSAIAHEMLIAGRSLDAAEAHALGFVNTLAPTGGALAAALDLAETIAAMSRQVVAEVKRGLVVRATAGEDAATAFEWQVGHRLQGEPDAEEGMRAFLEKRQPRFA